MELWRKVGDILGDREKDGREHALRSREGFGCDTRKAKTRPSNTPVKGLVHLPRLCFPA